MDHMIYIYIHIYIYIYIYIYHELKRVFQSIFRQDQTRLGGCRGSLCTEALHLIREVGDCQQPRWVSCDCWPTMPPSFSWLTPYHFMSDKFSQFLFGVNITIGLYMQCVLGQFQTSGHIAGFQLESEFLVGKTRFFSGTTPFL